MWLDDGEFTAIFEDLKRDKVATSPWAAAIAEAVAFVQANSGRPGEPPKA
jgi:hypothetical protein